jgi:hypothetical protein
MPTIKGVSDSTKQEQKHHQPACDMDTDNTQPDIDVVSITDPNPYDDSDGESNTTVQNQTAFYIPIERGHNVLSQAVATDTSQSKIVAPTSKVI